MSGVYIQGYIGDQSVIDSQVHTLDAWAAPGAAVSILGSYIDLEDGNPAYNLYHELETPWVNGYTVFMNLYSTRSASYIANGSLDGKIRNLADAYKSWVNLGGGRFAFLGPLPEMNGNWVSYGMDASNFKQAYWRIQNIFAQQGVPASTVRWVFVPNGWSKKGTPGFESYYPGDSTVDVVGFSAYNFGNHPYNPQSEWQDPLTVFNDPDIAYPQGDCLDRMYLMAPTKPIFIVQTGTTAYLGGRPNTSAKNDWLVTAYDYLAAYPHLRAVIYFNQVNWQGVDWPFYVHGDAAHQYQGYRQAMTNPAYKYISPQELSGMNLAP
jgi:hypothetical protein